MCIAWINIPIPKGKDQKNTKEKTWPKQEQNSVGEMDLQLHVWNLELEMASSEFQ